MLLQFHKWLGNYIFLNGPTSASDWGTKEDLAGQSCGDPDNFNDRTLDSVTEDTSILYCFGTCEATCPADPCADVVGVPAIADDFDGNATDILEYFDDALTTSVVDGASLGAVVNAMTANVGSDVLSSVTFVVLEAVSVELEVGVAVGSEVLGILGTVVEL